MKRRTFFMTLGLFLLFFNAAILLIATTMLRDSLRAQKERCLAEHYVIASSLARDLQALGGRDTQAEAALAELVRSYRYFSQDRKLSLALYRGDKLLYPAAGAPRDGQYRLDASALLLENRILSLSGRQPPVLSVAGRLPEPCQEYALVYQFEMGDAFAAWRRRKNALVLGGGLLSLLLAACLLWLMGRLFRPLERISGASRRIAEGHYGERLPLFGHDELTELTRNFNHMADRIASQILQLQQLAEQKQRFVDNFAHELRTPLTTIYGYAEYLQKAAISEAERHSALDFILSECRRMQNMAYQLLDMALLRGEKIAIGDVAVPALLRLVETAAYPKALSKNVGISFENELERLRGNRDLLQSLLLNLIDNAVKACAAGGMVRVRAYREGAAKVILVQDNGKGMTPEQAAHVTEAFYRVDKARSRRDGGAGLGLSLCAQIAALHGAKLQIASAPGRGTAVRVIFTT